MESVKISVPATKPTPSSTVIEDRSMRALWARRLPALS